MRLAGKGRARGRRALRGENSERGEGRGTTEP